MDIMIPFRFRTEFDKQLARGLHEQFGFYPRNISLYKLAFRHKSMSDTIVNGGRINNERLEYLGDAVLSAIVAEYLFKKYPTQPEGFLTEARSRIVSRASLNNLSKEIGLDNFIQYNQGRSVFRSISGNAFEAFVGALFVDRGYDYTRKIIIDKVMRVYINVDEIATTDTNFKSRLLEYAQKNKLKIKFNVVGVVGKGYNKRYEVETIVGEKKYGIASDFSIKGAEQHAAEIALQMINSENSKENQL